MLSLSDICFSWHALHHWTLRVFLLEPVDEQCSASFSSLLERWPSAGNRHPAIVSLDRLSGCRCLKGCWLENTSGRVFIWVERHQHFIACLLQNCHIDQKTVLSGTDMSKLIFLNWIMRLQSCEDGNSASGLDIRIHDQRFWCAMRTSQSWGHLP